MAPARYLAMQIRQSREQMGENTRALRAGTYQDFNRQLVDVFGVDCPVSVVHAGLSNPGQLEGTDALSFEFWISGVMHTYDNGYYQYRVGLLDEDRWQMHLTGLRTTLTRFPGARHWWTDADFTLASPEFAALVEEILGEESGRADR